MPVGNDLVAWRHPRCIGKSADKRFLDKVTHASEQNLITASGDPDLSLWMIWSLKEAAYKLSCFLGNRDKFRAKEFKISWRVDPDELGLPKFEWHGKDEKIQQGLNRIQVLRSRVAYKEQGYTGFSWAGHEFIHSLVLPNADLANDVYWGIARHSVMDKDDYSQAVRHFTIRSLNDFQKSHPVLEIIKDANGIPMLKREDAWPEWISLSHDQSLVSFAYLAED
jgi:phosphopantetheinyl transferase (holo-ACP synthase)